MLGGKVPFGPVYDVADIMADPHFAAREMIVAVEQPGMDAPVTLAGVPVKMTATPGAIRRRAPLLGEHTEAVLAEAGFSSDTISTLRAAGAFGRPRPLSAETAA